MNNRKLCRVIIMTLVFAVLLSYTCAFASSGRESGISDAKSAVVRVISEFADGGISTGSAFGVGKRGSEPEYFITNAHVCLNENGRLAKKIYILLDSKAVHVYDDEIADVNYSKAVACDVVNSDSIALYPDVAVLKAAKPISGRTCLPLLESSESVKDAQRVYALGFPGFVDELTRSGSNSYSLVAGIEDVTLTDGIVSKKTNSEAFRDTDVILHSAAISPGNSGGPLINEKGVVVGINTYGLPATETQFVSLYIDYAIDILEENEIEFTKLSSNAETIKILLWCVIGIVIAIATILILTFNKKAKTYVDKNAIRVQGVNGVFSGRRFAIESDVSFGRAPGNSLVYPTGTRGVSGNHCVLVKNGNRLYLKDVGSSYGTFLNGTQKLPANVLVSINIGDKFSLGSEDETFIITRKDGKL